MAPMVERDTCTRALILVDCSRWTLSLCLLYTSLDQRTDRNQVANTMRNNEVIKAKSSYTRKAFALVLYVDDGGGGTSKHQGMQ